MTNFGDPNDSDPNVPVTQPVVTKPVDNKATAGVSESVVAFSLSASPNPVASTTRLWYTVPVDARVNITVYDVLGREVNTLFNGQRRSGSYVQEYNTGKLSQGVYYCRLIATVGGKEYMQTQKLVKAE